MTECVLGIDLGTSSMKISAVDKQGKIVEQHSYDYPLIQKKAGYNEQDPEEWVKGTQSCISKFFKGGKVKPEDIAGISYSGQMHGLVLIDENNKVLRPAILWNDTRTTKQREQITTKMGRRFVDITANEPLEGFTLPKILWVIQEEPEIWAKVKTFQLPKDYLRFAMTGDLAMDYSDATGTVMLDINTNTWSQEICDAFDIDINICPRLIRSIDCVGNVTPEFAKSCGLSTSTKVFGGAADNAAGAVGSGVIKEGTASSSIGTSGVLLKYEKSADVPYKGLVQVEDHGVPDANYSMGVVMSAGYSFSWFRDLFFEEYNFSELTKLAKESPVGANGLMFTSYILGERAPHADSNIRGSFIGIDAMHTRADFARAVMEGITFGFRDLMNVYLENGQSFDKIIAIGGGAKSEPWKQMQADMYNRTVVSMKNEQGPGMGAAMIAAVGLGWFKDFEECADVFVKFDKEYQPIPENVDKYTKGYEIFKQVYGRTADLSKSLLKLHNED
ncbi:MAG: xylulokinase [Eggerthellaceae bacterium]|nr:xylulokinase [Eggerthellaceae bacterium]